MAKIDWRTAHQGRIRINIPDECEWLDRDRASRWLAKRLGDPKPRPATVASSSISAPWK
jgi:hypothetical protein